VSNAIRYSPAGSPVRVRLAVEAGTLRFIVEDQGMGIPAADLHRIFEAFERGSNIGNIMGTGLGLNIVKRMVDMLHGEIAVSSTLAGSCFTVTLPDQTITPLPS
jgi:signal transduction histidine kinase